MKQFDVDLGRADYIAYLALVDLYQDYYDAERSVYHADSVNPYPYKAVEGHTFFDDLGDLQRGVWKVGDANIPRDPKKRPNVPDVAVFIGPNEGDVYVDWDMPGLQVIWQNPVALAARKQKTLEEKHAAARVILKSYRKRYATTGDNDRVKFVMDPVSHSMVPRSRAVVLNRQVYDARELQRYIDASGDRKVPHSRRQLTGYERATLSRKAHN
jgi:hypothetical protein